MHNQIITEKSKISIDVNPNSQPDITPNGGIISLFVIYSILNNSFDNKVINEFSGQVVYPFLIPVYRA